MHEAHRCCPNSVCMLLFPIKNIISMGILYGFMLEIDTYDTYLAKIVVHIGNIEAQCILI